MAGGTNAYLPLITSNGNAELNPAYIGNLQLGGQGIWADWMINSKIENIRMSTGDVGSGCLTLWNNDFQNTVNNFYCQVTPISQRTSIGFSFGSQGNTNAYNYLTCDGENTCVYQHGGSAVLTRPNFTDRGLAIYPFVFIQAQDQLVNPVTDIEDTSNIFLADIYSDAPFAPLMIRGGQLTPGLSTGAFIEVNDGGSPVEVDGTDFAGTAAELLNVDASTNAPSVIRNSVLPGGYTRTNPGNGQYLSIEQSGAAEQVTSANLWACASVNKGKQIIVTDVDTCAYGSTTSHTTGSTWCREGCNGSNWLAGQ
jgi:hypothetical protein